MKICSKGDLRDDQRLSTWPVSEGKDSRYRNVYFRAETKSAGHFIMMERSLLGRLHVLANIIIPFVAAAIKHSVSCWILGLKVHNNVRLCRLLCPGLKIRWQGHREE